MNAYLYYFVFSSFYFPSIIILLHLYASSAFYEVLRFCKTSITFLTYFVSNLYYVDIHSLAPLLEPLYHCLFKKARRKGTFYINLTQFVSFRVCSRARTRARVFDIILYYLLGTLLTRARSYRSNFLKGDV